MTAQDFYQRPFTRAATNSWAVAALVCAIAGFFMPPVEIVAIVFGHIARGQIRHTRQDGAGMALAALIIGYTVLAIAVLGVLFLLLTAAHGPVTPGVHTLPFLTRAPAPVMQGTAPGLPPMVRNG